MKKLVGFFAVIITLAVTLSGCDNKCTDTSVSESDPNTARTYVESYTLVYIAASGNGKKYHDNPDCSNMQDVIVISIDKAEKEGYEPCKKCYKQ